MNHKNDVYMLRSLLDLLYARSQFSTVGLDDTKSSYVDNNLKFPSTDPVTEFGQFYSIIEKIMHLERGKSSC